MFVKRLGADMRIHRARQALARMVHLQSEYLQGGGQCTGLEVTTTLLA
jgi:hypothetical protein